MSNVANLKPFEKSAINKSKVDFLSHKNGIAPKKTSPRKIAAFSSEAEMLSYIDDIGAYVYGD
jgi:hypothetical protein